MRFLTSGLIAAAAVFSSSLYAQAPQPPRAPLQLENIKLPPGFEISLFAENITEARQMTLGDKGTLFVGSRRQGKVYAIKHDGKKAQEVLTIASDLRQPNGVAFRNGSLYVAEIHRVLRFDNIEANLATPTRPVVVYDKFPTEDHHGWKFIAFGPDGKLYIPVGAPCNICEPSDPYAAISALDVSKPGSAPVVYARGVRNTVGFDWNPKNKEIWFSDNNRDMMGDDTPPDEINRAPKAGMHFGFPFCHGGEVKDPEFGSKRECKEFTSPEIKFQGHVANLGLRFYKGKMFPAQYQGNIILAQHGSWNRTKRVGYTLQLVTVPKAGSKDAAKHSVFAEGWLKADETVMGRPVDVLNMPDGSMLVSDDFANVIYRISYKK